MNPNFNFSDKKHQSSRSPMGSHTKTLSSSKQKPPPHSLSKQQAADYSPIILDKTQSSRKKPNTTARPLSTNRPQDENRRVDESSLNKSGRPAAVKPLRPEESIQSRLRHILRDILSKMEKFNSQRGSVDPAKVRDYLEKKCEANRGLYYDFLNEHDSFMLKILIEFLYEEVENQVLQYKTKEETLFNRLNLLEERFGESQKLKLGLSDKLIQQSRNMSEVFSERLIFIENIRHNNELLAIVKGLINEQRDELDREKLLFRNEAMKLHFLKSLDNIMEKVNRTQQNNIAAISILKKDQSLQSSKLVKQDNVLNKYPAETLLADSSLRNKDQFNIDGEIGENSPPERKHIKSLSNVLEQSRRSLLNQSLAISPLRETQRYSPDKSQGNVSTFNLFTPEKSVRMKENVVAKPAGSSSAIFNPQVIDASNAEYVQQIERENSNLRDSVNKFNYKQISETHSLERLNELYAQLLSELQRSQSDTHVLEEENKKLRSKLQEARSDFATLSTNILKNANDRDVHSKMLLNEVDNLRRNNELQNIDVFSMEQRFKMREDELASELGVRRERLLNLIAERNAIEKEVLQLRLEKKEYATNLVTKETKIKELEALLEEYKKNMEITKKHERYLEEKYKELIGSQSLNNQNREQLEKKIADLNAAIILLEKENTKLLETISNYRDDYAALKRENLEIQQQLVVTREQLIERRDSIDFQNEYQMLSSLVLVFTRYKNNELEEKNRILVEKYLREAQGDAFEKFERIIKESKKREKVFIESLKYKITKELVIYEDFVWVLEIFAGVEAAIMQAFLGKKLIDNQQLATYVRDEFLKMETVKKKVDDWSAERPNLHAEIQALAKEEVDNLDFSSSGGRVLSYKSTDRDQKINLLAENSRLNIEIEHLKSKIQNMMLEVEYLRGRQSAGGDLKISHGSHSSNTVMLQNYDSFGVREVSLKSSSARNSNSMKVEGSHTDEDLYLMFQMQAIAIEKLLYSSGLE